MRTNNLYKEGTNLNAGSKLDPCEALIAYKAGNVDGFTAAYVAYKALTLKRFRVKLFAMDADNAAHSEERLLTQLTRASYARLYILGCTVHPDVLETITSRYGRRLKVAALETCNKAFELYAPELPIYSTSRCVRDINGAKLCLVKGMSTASITLNYFLVPIKAGKGLSKLVTYVEGYVLPNSRLGMITKHMHSYLMSLDPTINNWINLAEDFKDNDKVIELLHIGKGMYDKQQALAVKVAVAAKKGEDSNG